MIKRCVIRHWLLLMEYKDMPPLASLIDGEWVTDDSNDDDDTEAEMPPLEPVVWRDGRWELDESPLE